MSVTLVFFGFSCAGALADLYCTWVNKKGGGKEKNPLFKNKDGTANLTIASLTSLAVAGGYWSMVSNPSSWIFGAIYGLWRFYGAWTNYKAPGFKKGLNS